MREKRTAITRTQTIILIVVLVLAVGAGEFALNTANKNPNAPVEIDVSVIEDNPVLQLDHFYPDSIIAKPGENVTLAVQNGDDELRYFVLPEYNINLTLPAGTAGRVTFQISSLGNFTYTSPKTPPSAVSQGRPGPCLEGFFVVTQNATLLSSTSASSSSGPVVTNCLTNASG